MEIVTTPCLTLIIIIFLIMIRSVKHHRRSTTDLLPPGPKPYPIIGNILDISKDYHLSFHKLSQTYGPIVRLYLGSKLVVVVSSAEMAKEMIKTHERHFTNVSSSAVSEAYDHYKYSMLYRSTEDSEWRRLRKICKEHMFSIRCLDASQDLRQEMMTRLCDYVRKCSVEGRAMDVGETAFITTINLITASLFSTGGSVTDYESGEAHEFKESIEGAVDAISSSNVADLFTILKPFDPQGVKKRAELHIGNLLSTFEGWVNRRLEARKGYAEGENRKNDMFETLHDVAETSDHGDFTCRDIKHLLMDLYVGASSAASAAVEWTMTELIRNPDVMSKVQDEVRTVIGMNEDGVAIQESDISKLPYLKAVIKETLRYHPPNALFFRALKQDIEVGGYVIPKDTQINFNVYSIGRDPSAWSVPDKFDPERFMGTKNIDFKGQHFEFLPFGSGRRTCPGLPLADRMMHHIVATLVHKYDWKLEGTMKPEDLDLKEKPVLTLRKNVPLMAIPVKYKRP